MRLWPTCTHFKFLTYNNLLDRIYICILGFSIIDKFDIENVYLKSNFFRLNELECEVMSSLMEQYNRISPSIDEFNFLTSLMFTNPSIFRNYLLKSVFDYKNNFKNLNYKNKKTFLVKQQTDCREVQNFCSKSNGKSFRSPCKIIFNSCWEVIN